MAAVLPPAEFSSLCFALTEHAPLPIATVEGATHLVRYVNPAFCRLMGEPREDLLGRPLSELLPARDRCVTLLDRVFRTKEPQSHIEQEPSKPHPVFWSYTMWPVLEDDLLVGVMIQVTETAQLHADTIAVNEALLLGSLRQHEKAEAAEALSAQLWLEMADRKQAEEALRVSEAFSRSIIESSPDCIKVLDLEGNLLSLLAGQELLGIDDPARFLSTSWLEFWEGDDRRAARAALAAAAAGGEGHFVGFLLTPRGEGKWWDVAISPLLTTASEPARLLAVSRDVTQHWKAEEALRASEDRFRVLFDLGPVAIFSCDRDGMIQNYNRRAAELWGREVPCGEGGARHCGSLKLFHADGRPLPHEESPIVAVLATGVTVKDAEVFIERPDGSRIAVSVTFAPLQNERGETTGAITAFHDITARRVLESSLVSRAEELARADRSKDEFLAMLAHELRNPLAPLRHAAEILRAADASADEREQAQRILGRQIENMTRMIDDLLDVSRITEGKIELRPQPAALGEILTAAANLARSGMKARAQVFTLTLPAVPIFLHADATRLEQVFGNLLSNACKYSAVGCHIALSAEVVEESLSSSEGPKGREVVVRVTDDGMGIAPELLPHVFDLFVQASRTLDRTHGGLGIGLTLVQRLVKLHGGTVEACSGGLGRGSTFIVRLPILAHAPPLPPAPSAPAGLEIPRRLLIVDDNEDSARSLAMLQRRRGHETRTAFTGPDAVVAAGEFLPEVVLLDIGLPGMDGYEVARRLRAMPALEGAFIIAMSGYGRDEDVALARLAGFDQYLVKPIDLALLREWLRSRPEASMQSGAEGV